MAVNFTEENLKRLTALIMSAVMENVVVATPFGTKFATQQLLHDCAIPTLVKIRESYDRKIADKKSVMDEWTATEVEIEELAELQSIREMVNLMIGYRRMIVEKNEIDKKIAANNAQIKAIENAAMTPEQQVAKLKAENEKLMQTYGIADNKEEATAEVENEATAEEPKKTETGE